MSGRPEGGKSGYSVKEFKRRIKAMLEMPTEGGRTRYSEVIDALYRKAQEGDVMAIRELIDRTDGKVTDKLEVSGIPEIQGWTVNILPIEETKTIDADVDVKQIEK